MNNPRWEPKEHMKDLYLRFFWKKKLAASTVYKYACTRRTPQENLVERRAWSHQPTDKRESAVFISVDTGISLKRPF